MPGQYIARGREQHNYAVTEEINIDNGSGTTADYILLVPDKNIYIEHARVFYTEATDTSGAASATVKIGTAIAGATVVAATNLQVSKAIGSTTSLVIAAPYVAAGSILVVRHTGIATTEAGKYKVQIRYRILNS